MITQNFDRLRKEYPVCLDEDALIKLLRIEHGLTLLREGLGRLGSRLGLDAGVVRVIAEAAAGADHAAAASDYLTDVFGELVREGTDQEYRGFVRLMGDFLFALKHAEDMVIDRVGGAAEEEWSIRGGGELIARVRGGEVEWLRFYCHAHGEWLPEGGCEHAPGRTAPP